MKKLINFSKEARKSIKKGIDIAVKAVSSTYGPKGRNVLIGKPYLPPVITNDGISVLKELHLENEFEDLGVALVREASKNTSDKAGDGTTTTTVLLGAILDEQFGEIDDETSLIDTKADLMERKRKIDEAKNLIIKELKKMSKKIEDEKDIKKVASIAAESEEIGEIIANAFNEVGENGSVIVEDGLGYEIQSEIVKGAKIDIGLHSPYLATDDKGNAEVENPYILITDHKFNASQIAPLIQKIANDGKKELIVFAEYYDKAMIDIMIANRIKGLFHIIPIQIGQNKKETLEDFAIITGGKFTRQVTDKLEAVELKDLGTCKKIIVSNNQTIILGGKGKTEERTKSLKEKLEKSDSQYDKDKLKERIGRLNGGAAVIKVGAPTDTEKEYLKLKIVNAINSVSASMEEGVVKGAGQALLEISQKFSDNILKNAIKKPYEQIQENAGGKLKISKDIIDPTKVVINAVENACSVAGMVLTTEVAIADKNDDDKKD